MLYQLTCSNSVTSSNCGGTLFFISKILLYKIGKTFGLKKQLQLFTVFFENHNCSSKFFYRVLHIFDATGLNFRFLPLIIPTSIFFFLELKHNGHVRYLFSSSSFYLKFFNTIGYSTFNLHNFCFKFFLLG